MEIIRKFQNIANFTFNLASEMSSLTFFLIANYVLCYFITTLTINTMSVGDKVFDLLWYQLPSKKHFNVQMIIRRAQYPFELRALGVFVCSLETYLEVRRDQQIVGTNFIDFICLFFYFS